MYPMLMEGVAIGTYREEGSCVIHYYVENDDGEEFEITGELYHALNRADGTRSLALLEEDKELKEELKKYHIIRTSRFVRERGAINRWIVFPVGRIPPKVRAVLWLINTFLPLLSLLMLAIGLMMQFCCPVDFEMNWDWAAYIFLFLVSICLHELGHFIAGAANGYGVSDVGILLLWVIPIGAYVACYERNGVEPAGKKAKIQFSLAGIEMNLLIAGVMLIIGVLVPAFFVTSLMVAAENGWLAFINLLPSRGLDGESALSALCGVESIFSTASGWLFKKEKRRQLYRSGAAGFVSLAFFAVVCLSRVVLFAIIGISLLLSVLSFF